MIFAKHSESGYRALLDGIQMRTLTYGEKTLMAEFLLQKDSLLPRHSHPYEQTGYLVRGRMRLTIDTEPHEVGPGDSWCIPAGVEHMAQPLEDSVAIEVFSPVREDYLPK
jgi:quercetin dioxygenase-like cupin family protein